MFKQKFEIQDKARSSIWEQFPPPQVSSFSTHLTGADSDTQVEFYPPRSQLHYPSTLPLYCWLTVRERCARVPYRGRERWLGYPSAPPSNFQPPRDLRCARPTSFTGRWDPGAPGVGFRCRQFVRVADSRGEGMFKVSSKNYKFIYPLLSFS